MQIELVVNLDFGDEDPQAYVLRTERAYSRVPAEGEVVSLDDGYGTQDFPVGEVSWKNDGTPSLDFDILAEEEPDITEVWLLGHGYSRLDAPGA